MTSTNSRSARPSMSRKAVAAAAAGAMILGLGGAVVAATSAQADTTVTSGSLNWGFRENFRQYVANQTAALPPIGPAPAGSRITVNAPATFDTAAAPTAVGSAESKPYIFPATGTSVASTTNVNVQTDGDVVYNFPSHAFTVTLTDPAIVVNGASKQIVADINVVVPANTVGQTPGTYGGNDVAIADIATVNTTIAGDAKSATITGSGLTLTAAGATALNNFLNAGDALDNFSASVVLQDPAGPAVPTVVVSKSVANPAGDTITVTGSGFDPASSLGTRPPLSGVAAGTYITFGKFAPVWKPSLGTAAAPSSSRKTMTAAQGGLKWAVPAASITTVGGPPAGGIELTPAGTFSTTLTVQRDFATTGMPNPGNYGIYTYAGSGGTNAAFETYTPITWTAPTASAPGVATTVLPGGSVAVQGSGFNAGETVNAVLHSTPTTIGTLTADGTGAVSGSVVVPSNTEFGAHTLHLVGATTGIDVTAASFAVGATDLTAFETITTEVVPTGALSISIADSTVVLPSPVLSTNGMALETSGELNPITVTDLRTADPGWSLTGTITDFAATAGSFDGNLLAWTPEVISTGSGQTVTAGAAASGLKTGKVIANGAADAGRGTAQVGADLSLTLPTTTDPGVYVATLTLTAV